ncbi:Mov34/MPN/PAD-1 family protein [Candidatus Solirubrobacter pratensis]|uniref:Mov34/MPN/PAD-1 family protein n=1 Tax=Candidatus Solirubrobacter pratensis TaxID=1298857 RepID=UPI0003FF975D|nr:Mov34/MPN/PAD-1 family protein [Candidatus Solirubrobacter pratensis]
MLSDGDIVGALWMPGVRDEVYDHVFSDLANEVGGFLIGRARNDGRVAVRGIVPALRADGQTASLTFTHDAWEDVHRELEQRFAGEEIVGWYHSHPGFGIFLSEHDLFIHRNFFAAAHQIAYVVDPHAGEEGIFAWQHGEVVNVGKAATPRPGQRPAAGDTTPARQGYPPVAMALLVAVGIALGAGGWLVLGAPADDPPPPAAPAQGVRGSAPGQPARQQTGRGRTTQPAQPTGQQPDRPKTVMRCEQHPGDLQVCQRMPVETPEENP